MRPISPTWRMVKIAVQPVSFEGLGRGLLPQDPLDLTDLQLDLVLHPFDRAVGFQLAIIRQ
jgi:hypothetical protein